MNIKKIRPLYNNIITTYEAYKEDVKKGSVIVQSAGAIKEYQTVVAVGPMVRDIKVGDVVMINPARYAVKKYKENSLKDGVVTENPIVGYNFNLVELNGVPHMFLVDQDIMYVLEDFDENNPVIEIAEPKILV